MLQDYNWILMANNSFSFTLFPLGQTCKTLRQPNYNPCWGGWAEATFQHNFNLSSENFRGHGGDTNNAWPVIKVWNKNSVLSISSFEWHESNEPSSVECSPHSAYRKLQHIFVKKSKFNFLIKEYKGYFKYVKGHSVGVFVVAFVKESHSLSYHFLVYIKHPWLTLLCWLWLGYVLNETETQFHESLLKKKKYIMLTLMRFLAAFSPFWFWYMVFLAIPEK